MIISWLIYLGTLKYMDQEWQQQHTKKRSGKGQKHALGHTTTNRSRMIPRPDTRRRRRLRPGNSIEIETSARQNERRQRDTLLSRNKQLPNSESKQQSNLTFRSKTRFLKLKQRQEKKNGDGNTILTQHSNNRNLDAKGIRKPDCWKILVPVTEWSKARTAIDVRPFICPSATRPKPRLPNINNNFLLPQTNHQEKQIQERNNMLANT